jgi:capping protein alpha
MASDILTDHVASGIARVSNLKAAKVVTAPSGHKTLLTPAAEIDPCHYYDATEKTTYGVDHLTLVTRTENIAASQDNSLSSLCDELQLLANSYANTAYSPTEEHAAGAYAKEGIVTIVLTGEKTNLKNFWSGRWTSVWTISDLDADADCCTFAGEIKVHVHYFEDGNLQMQSTKFSPVALMSFTSDSDLAAKVIARIQDEENALQGGLEELYGSMNNETIRSMRRVMPITKTKMEWNVNAVRMVRQVRK